MTNFVRALIFTVFGFATLFAPVAAPVMAAETTAGTQGTPDLGLAYPAESGLASTDVRTTIARLIRLALTLLGTIFFVIVIYAGFTWMTAGGNEDKISSAKNWIIGAVIGLVIILASYSITTFVIKNLVAETTRVDDAPSSN